MSLADATPHQRVYPLGHLLGVRVGEAGVHVRLGSTRHRLSAAEFTVWGLAHGDPAGGPGPWGADQVLATAESAGLPDAAAALADVEALGLLARAEPGGESGTALARRVRLVPLVPGLGNSAEDPRVYTVGLPGQPLVAMTSTLYDLFQWAHLDTSLWRACEGAAATARQAGASDPALCDPGELLGLVLGELHTLLVANAVLLDTWGVA